MASASRGPEKPLKTRIVFAVFLVSCLLLSSCGGGSSSSTIPQSSLTNGNWSIAATSNTSQITVQIGGDLEQSGGSVAGIMHLLDPICFEPFLDDVPFTGKFSGDHLTMTSAAINGQVIKVDATGSGDSLSGTYSIAGGCAAGDQGTIVGSSVGSITGTWKSTFTQGSATVSVTTNLTEAAVADAHGRFPLSGTFAVSGSPCTTGGTLVNIDLIGSSSVWGSVVVANVVSNPVGGGQGGLVFAGFISDPLNPSKMTGTYISSGGLCQDAPGTLLQFIKQ